MRLGQPLHHVSARRLLSLLFTAVTMRAYLADDQFPPLKNDLLLRAAKG
jgi:hypothetical protein